jgi:thiamine pyrophosphokinase
LPNKALLISGSPIGLSAADIQKLAAAVDYAAAVDSGAIAAKEAGLKLDLLVGDMDSIEEDVLQNYREEGTEIVKLNPVKNDTDLEHALDVLNEKGFEKVTIVNAMGGRLDHELATLGAVSTPRKLKSIIISNENIIAPLCAGDTINLAELSLVPGDLYSIIAVDDKTIVTETGVEYEIEKHPFKALSGRGVSNIVKTKDAKIKVHQGRILIIKSFGENPEF